MLPERRRVRLRVHGRVQGVWFRDSARRQAERHGVAGWARNCPDGTVEAVYEGAPDAVDALVRWTEQGPPNADVTAVDVRDEPPEGLRRFDVR